MRDPRSPDFLGRLKYVSEAETGGVIRAHGVFPGFFPAASERSILQVDLRDLNYEGNKKSVVYGELYEIIDTNVLKNLDDWEEYDPSQIDKSNYLRKSIQLKNQKLSAWVYVSNQSQNDFLVESGRWEKYCMEVGLEYQDTGPHIVGQVLF